MAEVLPSSRKWLRYLVPRALRSLEAMPRDGVVPISSYGLLHQYVDPVVMFREGYRWLADVDIYERYPFREIVDFVTGTLDDGDRAMSVYTGTCETAKFIGSNAFFSQIVATFSDPAAASLANILLEAPEEDFFHPGAGQRILSRNH